MEDLLAEARRFREILEPSLREAAESYLAGFRAKGLANQGKPSVECRPMGSSGETYVSPDGKDERSVAERHHVAKVEETVITYRVVDIPSIATTGSGTLPFEGSVAVEVTTARRKADSIHYDTADVPSGYRKKEGGGGGGSLHTPNWRPAPKGLPVALDPEPLPAALPPAVRKSIDEAVSKCLQAPPITERVIYRVKFQYNAPARRWDPLDVPVKE